MVICLNKFALVIAFCTVWKILLDEKLRGGHADSASRRWKTGTGQVTLSHASTNKRVQIYPEMRSLVHEAVGKSCGRVALAFIWMRQDISIYRS